jgi:8-oxo-dGTP pyrophosphatase MutT (NUDIX family)
MASYGICCFRVVPSTETEVLILRRRYTYAYCAIIYGNYRTSHDLSLLVDCTTVDEKITLLTADFGLIWRRVFVGDTLSSDKYHRAHTIFTDMIEILGIDEYSSIVKSSKVAEVTWELPKGRRDPHETEIECACREFCEETAIQRDDMRVIADSMIRCFFRDNESLYHVRFWAATIKNMSAEPIISLMDGTYKEHDVAKFVPISLSRKMLPKQYVRVVNLLKRTAKK